LTKEAVIIGGANGSGKTTFARSFEEKYPFEFVNADEIAKQISPNNIQSARVEAGKLFLKKIQELIDADENLIIESTLSGRALLGLIKKIKDRGYSIKLIYIFLEAPGMCIERIRERVSKGGHPVPDDDVVRRFYRSKRNFWNLYKELADKWHLIYNSERSFIEFAFSQKGSYVIHDEELFQEFIKDIGKEESNEGR
jgi:predicted ABC-type ATPase